MMTNIWKELKKAPFTAWFGMIVIAIYIFVSIFAGALAPFGETEVVGYEYEPGAETTCWEPTI